MERKGLYFSLVTTQMALKEDKTEEDPAVDGEEVVKEDNVVASDALESLNLEDAEEKHRCCLRHQPKAFR